MIVLWGSPMFRSGRVQWMLNELGVPYELRPIQSRNGDTQTEEFLKLNPRGKIPCLQDGDLVLAESVAINTYLCDQYGKGQFVPAPCTKERAIYVSSVLVFFHLSDSL